MRTILFIILCVACVSPVMAQNGMSGGKFFARADADGDGRVSEEEYHAQMQERFEKLDTNGDRYLSQEEADAARQKFRDRIRERRQNRY